MIKIFHNEPSLTYDIHALVGAFYSGEIIAVTPETDVRDRRVRGTYPDIEISVSEDGAEVRIYETEDIVSGITTVQSADNGIRRDKHDYVSQPDEEPGITENSGTCGMTDMQYHTEDGVQGIMLGEPFKDEEKKSGLKCRVHIFCSRTAGWKKRTDRNPFKLFLYDCLRIVCGRSLPWGNITGIRPTKIALEKIENGESKEDILKYMKSVHEVSDRKSQLAYDVAKREHEILGTIHIGVAINSSNASKTLLSPERVTTVRGDIAQDISMESNSQMTDVLASDNTLMAMGASSANIKAGVATPAGCGYSVYIGIPFCPTTCMYCSFTSYPISSWKDRVDEYLDAVFKEIDYVAKEHTDKILDTVYIGGGTPTSLSADQMKRLLMKIRDTLDCSHLAEFTVEAGRADSITSDKLKVMKECGITRISVNPQTMKQATLDFIGRRHTVEQVKEAFYAARTAGFDNINMDIILGLPGEDDRDVINTMEQIEAMSPDSLTAHSLAIKKSSALSKWIEKNGVPVLNNTDETIEIVRDSAAKMDMKPYYLYRQKHMTGNMENVGYARDGRYGIYNILIMEEKQTIIALGAGSITKRVYTDGSGRIERCENARDIATYISNIDEMIERKRKLFADDSMR